MCILFLHYKPNYLSGKGFKYFIWHVRYNNENEIISQFWLYLIIFIWTRLVESPWRAQKAIKNIPILEIKALGENFLVSFPVLFWNAFQNSETKHISKDVCQSQRFFRKKKKTTKVKQVHCIKDCRQSSVNRPRARVQAWGSCLHWQPQGGQRLLQPHSRFLYPHPHPFLPEKWFKNS